MSRTQKINPALAAMDAEIAEAEETHNSHAADLETARLVLKALRDARARMAAAEERSAPPAPQRRPRMDIAEGIVEFLRSAPHSIKELATGLERKPSQIQSAIVRLMNAGRVEDMADGNYRLVVRAEAAQ